MSATANTVIVVFVDLAILCLRTAACRRLSSFDIAALLQNHPRVVKIGWVVKADAPEALDRPAQPPPSPTCGNQ